MQLLQATAKSPQGSPRVCRVGTDLLFLSEAQKDASGFKFNPIQDLQTSGELTLSQGARTHRETRSFARSLVPRSCGAFPCPRVPLAPGASGSAHHVF